MRDASVNIIINNAVVEKPAPALVAAVKANQEKKLQALIDAGANVKVIYQSGNNLLTHACKNHKISPQIIEKLLKAGANVHHRDSEGNTPLSLVCARDPIDGIFIMEQLFEYGATTDTKNHKGYSPFDVAVQKMRIYL